MSSEIFIIKPGDDRWEDTISFAQDSMWSAGPYLADMMREERFLDWERVLIAYEDGVPAGYCNFTKYDELPEQYGFSPFIGFVYVDPSRRGHRLSEKLIRAAIDYARSLGYDKVYLMSGEHGLYEKYGFVKTGEYPTIYGDVDQLFEISV